MNFSTLAGIGLLSVLAPCADAAPLITGGQCQHQWNVYTSKRPPKSFASTASGATCGWQSRGPVEQIDAKALAEWGERTSKPCTVVDRQ